MESKNLIHIAQFCTLYEIEFSFLDALKEHGLIDIIVVGNDSFLLEEQLSDIEKMMRLHYELEINVQGIDTVVHLLYQINALQDELKSVKNKLAIIDFN
jgi:hypothetical protein